jgi:hypothetical protein
VKARACLVLVQAHVAVAEEYATVGLLHHLLVPDLDFSAAQLNVRVVEGGQRSEFVPGRLPAGVDRLVGFLVARVLFVYLAGGLGVKLKTGLN